MESALKQILLTKEHEWVLPIEGKPKQYKVGISDFAVEQLGDIVGVDWEDTIVGREVERGDSCLLLESVKSVSDVYAPLSGTIVALNEDLAEGPEKIKDLSFEESWFFILQIREGESVEPSANLITEDEYKNYLKECEES